jgi:hypothetical protein
MPGNDAIDMQRVAAAAHYVIAKADPGKLGHVKLNKILWYVDLEHYRWHGTTITGLRFYSRTLHGPMSQDITRAVRWLVEEGKAIERSVTVADYQRREMVSLKPPAIAAFTAKQVVILNQMTKIVVPLTASQISRLTHDDPLWKELGNNDAMSVATGSVMSPPPAPK